MAGARRHSAGGSHGGREGGPSLLQLVLSVALMVFGGIFFVLNMGLFGGDITEILSRATRLWPLLLVLIGVILLLAKGSRWWIGIAIGLSVVLAVVAVSTLSQGRLPVTAADSRTVRLEKSLGSLRESEVRLNFSAGDLALESLPSYSTLLAEGQLSYRQGGKEPTNEFRETDSKGYLQIASPDSKRSFLASGKDDSWTLGLTSRIPLDLIIQGGAISGRLSLTDMKLRSLRVEVEASKLDVRLPQEAGRTAITIKAGATSSINLDIPKNVEARIKANLGLASLSIDGDRFQKRDGFYISSKFDSAQNRLDLDLDAGTSSVTIR
ncbi:MAG: toast rack family protein [Dehalococcoidia bacterium]|nr:toast rack family protein [Dehalococcoidia bacterium]